MREFHPELVRSIIVLRLYFLGDVLLSTPVLASLKGAFPNAHLAVLIKRRARAILERNPHVDEIIEYDGCESYHSPRWLLRLASSLRRRRFDLAIDLTGDHRSSLLLLAADPGYRAGFNHAGLGFVLDRRIPYLAEGHVVDHLLSSVEGIGAPIERPAPAIYVTEEEERAAAMILENAGLSSKSLFLVVSPGANRALRRWPPERFGRVAARARDEFGMRSVVTGGPRDADLGEQVVRSSGGAAVSLAGRTSVREYAALAGLARAFVGNDSGPMHIAAARGTPVVALFGPTTPERFAPRGAKRRIIWSGAECSPCGQRRCVRPDARCMDAIDVEEVVASLRSVLEEEAR